MKRGSRAALARHAVRRAAVLFLLGIIVNGFPYFHLHHLRIYGVLQRIAVCYLLVGLFYLWDRRVWTKAVVLAALLIGYWSLVRWVPVPGAGVPGRDVPFLDKNQNIVAWVDRHLMPGHLYEDAPLYDARDPEGLLSDLPAIGTTLLGLLAAMWLRGKRRLKTKALGLAAGAAACLALGYLWSVWFPLNKKMWTSSYVLVAAGWPLLLFALVHWTVEERGWGRNGWKRITLWPWLVFGSNAITAYVFSELLASGIETIHFKSGGRASNPLAFANHHLFTIISDPGWRAFVYSVAYTLICFVPVWMLYRKKIFVRV